MFSNCWVHKSSSPAQGSLLQEHARDSFENLLFGLCRFYELTGHFPDDLLVIGYEFKHERFADLHRAALKWPDQRFSFVGTPALTATAQEVTDASQGCWTLTLDGCQRVQDALQYLHTLLLQKIGDSVL